MIDHADAPRGIELGQPGASARAEFERRRRRDASAPRRRFGRVLAPVVALVTGIRPSTARWRVGGEAEERVGRLLSAAVGDAGVVLHDRAVPHGRGQHRPHRGRPFRRLGHRHQALPRASAPGGAARPARRTGPPRCQRPQPEPPPRRCPASVRPCGSGRRAADDGARRPVLRRRRVGPVGAALRRTRGHGDVAGRARRGAGRPRASWSRRAVGPLGPARPRLSALQRRRRPPARGGSARPAVTGPRFAGHARRQ